MAELKCNACLFCRGASSIVMKARHKGSNEVVADKVITKSVSAATRFLFTLLHCELM